MSNEVLAAEGGVSIGKHWTVQVLGFTLNMDTILATVIAAVVILGLGIWMSRGASATQPTKIQILFETIKEQVEEQVEDALGVRTAPWVVPFAAALGLLILFSNLLAFLPTEAVLPPPTADVNLTFALALTVMLCVWTTAIKRNPGHFFAEFKNPLAIIEEIVKPLSLALRLFGNMLSGVIMIQIILLMPIYVFWLPFGIWKAFEIFISILQAVIFTILTIVYFGSAVQSDDTAKAAH